MFHLLHQRVIRTVDISPPADRSIALSDGRAEGDVAFQPAGFMWRTWPRWRWLLGVRHTVNHRLIDADFGCIVDLAIDLRSMPDEFSHQLTFSSTQIISVVRFQTAVTRNCATCIALPN